MDVAQKTQAEPPAMRDRIQDFEDLLLESPDQIEIPIEQIFWGGMYVRYGTLKQGTMAAGHIHKHPCITFVMSGEIDFVSEEGCRKIIGPAIFKTPAGAKRAVRAVTDVYLATVHAHEGAERDAESMLALLTVPSYDQLESHSKTPARSDSCS